MVQASLWVTSNLVWNMFSYLLICVCLVYVGVGSDDEEIGEARTGVVSLNWKNFLFPGKPWSHLVASLVDFFGDTEGEDDFKLGVGDCDCGDLELDDSDSDFFGWVVLLNLGHFGGSLFRNDGGPDDGPEDEEDMWEDLASRLGGRAGTWSVFWKSSTEVIVAALEVSFGASEEDTLGHLGGIHFSDISVSSSSPPIPKVSNTAKPGNVGICLWVVPR